MTKAENSRIGTGEIVYLPGAPQTLGRVVAAEADAGGDQTVAVLWLRKRLCQRRRPEGLRRLRDLVTEREQASRRKHHGDAMT